MTEQTDNIDSRAVALAGMGAEYCALVATCAQQQPADFCRRIVRMLPRLFITIDDIQPESQAPDAIYGTMDEATYDAAREAMAAAFGEYDTYLDTPADDMRYSDTPVAASLSEKLADIYQEMFDMADTIRQSPSTLWADILADIRARFDNYLSQTICDALRAANYTLRTAPLGQED